MPADFVDIIIVLIAAVFLTSGVTVWTVGAAVVAWMLVGSVV